MHFSVPLFCIVTLVSAWTGSDTFAPKRSAEVIFLADATTTADQISSAVLPLTANIGDLFDAYKSAGLSFQVGYHVTGGQNGKCWRPRLDLTDDVSAVKKAFDEGPIMDATETSKIAAFWNMVASVAAANVFSKDPATRRVVVVISEKTPPLRPVDDLPLVAFECVQSAPSLFKFRHFLESRDIGFLYSAEHYHVATTEEAAAEISGILTRTDMTDYKVVSQSSYPESGPSGWSIIPALAEMLSEDWIESRSVQIWPGKQPFVPNQNAQVIFLVDSTIYCNVLTSAMSIKDSMVTLFKAYKKAGLTLQVGLHVSGAQEGKCWKATQDLTDDVAGLKLVLHGPFVATDELQMEPDFWNAVLYVAGSGKFSATQKNLRKVVVVLSGKAPKWGSKVTQPDMSSIECGHPSPTALQFKNVLEKNNVGLLYSGDHAPLSELTDILQETGLSDWMVVNAMSSGSGSGKYSGRGVMYGLGEVLSGEWIATTTTTLSPADAFGKCFEQCYPCH